MGFCWKRKKSPKIYCNITSFLIIKAKKLFLIPCEISENVLLLSFWDYISGQSKVYVAISLKLPGQINDNHQYSDVKPIKTLLIFGLGSPDTRPDPFCPNYISMNESNLNRTHHVLLGKWIGVGKSGWVLQTYIFLIKKTF